MKAKAVLCTDVGKVELGEADIPDPGAGEVLIRAAYTVVSPGTELRCLAGGQEGSESHPFIPGYAMTGTIAAVGPGCSIEEGTAILCGGTARSSRHLLWGGHVEWAIQPSDRVIPLPDEVGLLDGAVAKLAGIAYHGVRLSKPAPHEQVAVVGLGAIGQLSARLHAISGARVVAADIATARVEVARSAGIEAIAPAGSLQDAFQALQPYGADIVVDSTGVSSVLPACIPLARETPWDDELAIGARFIIQGSYPGDVGIPYQAAFMKELTFLLPRDTPTADIRAVLDLLARRKLDVSGVVSEVREPESAPFVYSELRDSRHLITVAFQWHS